MRGVISIFGLLLASLMAATPVNADEPAKQFLDALRENGYYDVALDYLDSIEQSDLITDGFREALSFERAETLISSVVKLRDLKLIDQRLDAAQKLLTEYADTIAVGVSVCQFLNNVG